MAVPPAPARRFDWNGKSIQVVDVWDGNLDDEMARLRKHLERFPIVSVTTEFPGVVLRPLTHKATGKRSASLRDVESYHYEAMRLNVEQVRMVQLGLALFDSEGNMPPSNEVWQFHVRFDPESQAAAPGALHELARSGISVDRLAAEGIEEERLGEALTVSGLVLVPGCSWTGFHSGYDVAHLVRLLTGKPLPVSPGAFFDLVALFFPSFVDCKALAASVPSPRPGGLAAVARSLSVPLPAASRQAAPRCVLTIGVYLALVRAAGGAGPASKLAGRKLFGLPGASGGSVPSTKGRPGHAQRRR